MRNAAKDSAQSTQLDAFLQREANEHRVAFESFVQGLREPFAQMLHVWHSSIRQGGKLLVFGNGGSAGNAQHIATELAVRYETDRAPIAALALTADSLLVTAAANDLGFEAVFSRQIAALGCRGDVAVGLSTSGRSPNVLAALREARGRGLHTTGFIGGDGVRCANCAMQPLSCLRKSPRVSRRCTCWSRTCCAKRWKPVSG